jgi:hypothetical protein
VEGNENEHIVVEFTWKLLKIREFAVKRDGIEIEIIENVLEVYD